jgi:hypothetical protein
VAPQRDFLVLLPAAEDTSPEPLADDALLAASRQAAGTQHPSVWSLREPEGDPPAIPGLTHEEEENLWLLHFDLPVQSEGSQAETLRLVLVIAGHAPEA